jgi:hypothetical protein
VWLLTPEAPVFHQQLQGLYRQMHLHLIILELDYKLVFFNPRYILMALFVMVVIHLLVSHSLWEKPWVIKIGVMQ